MTHRYYDPGTGKFLNRDPIGYAGGANLYGFADGNPVNEMDPEGTQADPEPEKKSENHDAAEDGPLEWIIDMNESRKAEERRQTEREEAERREDTLIAGISKKSLQNFVASLRRDQFWQGSTDFSGKSVYQRNDLIDPARTDATGRTSLQRMEQQGQPPIGPDGKPLVLHHLTQDEEGPMAEMEQSFHDNYRRVIHINTNTKGSNINRPEFRAWSKRYWRSRAGDFR